MVNLAKIIDKTLKRYKGSKPDIRTAMVTIAIFEKYKWESILKNMERIDNGMEPIHYG